MLSDEYKRAQEGMNLYLSERLNSLGVAPATEPAVSETEAMARKLDDLARSTDSPHEPDTLEEAAEMLRELEQKIDGLYYELQYGNER